MKEQKENSINGISKYFFAMNYVKGEIGNIEKETANDVLSVIELLKENLDFWKIEDTEEYNTA